MKVWEEPYYVGPLSAADRHGAAYQRPQSCQVIVQENRAVHACGEVRVEFIARGDLEKMPVATVVRELAESLDAGKALEIARRSPFRWSQRLGYILELVGHENLAKVLEQFVRKQARSSAQSSRRLGPTWVGHFAETAGDRRESLTTEAPAGRYDGG